MGQRGSWEEVRQNMRDDRIYTIVGEPKDGDFFTLVGHFKTSTNITAAKILTYNGQYVYADRKPAYMYSDGGLVDPFFIIANSSVYTKEDKSDRVPYFIGSAVQDVYIVPQDLGDLLSYINKYRERVNKIYAQTDISKIGEDLATLLFEFFKNESADIQRTYNGLQSQGDDGFVSDFTPAATFLFAVVCYICGLERWVAREAAGIINLISKKGNWEVKVETGSGNSMRNEQNIYIGWAFSQKHIQKTKLPDHISGICWVFFIWKT